MLLLKLLEDLASMEKQYTKDKNENQARTNASMKNLHNLPLKKEEKKEEKVIATDTKTELAEHKQEKHEEQNHEHKIESDVKKEIEAKVVENSNAKATHEEKGKKDEKKEKPKIVKKEEAVVKAMNLPISTKHSMAICDYIRGKNPEKMIPELVKVINLQRAIPMKGEIPHRKGNIMAGRYPVNACKVFVTLMKSLAANSQVNGIEEPVIVTAVPNRASKVRRRGGREKFKRTNVLLIAKEKVRENKTENKKVEEKK